MRDPDDWDYVDLRYRLARLTAPPYVSGSSSPGSHCAHCSKPDGDTCPLTCRTEYTRIYGFEPDA
jgi:hypothetical protein